MGLHAVGMLQCRRVQSHQLPGPLLSGNHKCYVLRGQPSRECGLEVSVPGLPGAALPGAPPPLCSLS